MEATVHMVVLKSEQNLRDYYGCDQGKAGSRKLEGAIPVQLRPGGCLGREKIIVYNTEKCRGTLSVLAEQFPRKDLASGLGRVAWLWPRLQACENREPLFGSQHFNKWHFKKCTDLGRCIDSFASVTDENTKPSSGPSDIQLHLQLDPLAHNCPSTTPRSFFIYFPQALWRKPRSVNTLQVSLQCSVAMRTWRTGRPH